MNTHDLGTRGLGTRGTWKQVWLVRLALGCCFEQHSNMLRATTFSGMCFVQHMEAHQVSEAMRQALVNASPLCGNVLGHLDMEAP